MDMTLYLWILIIIPVIWAVFEIGLVLKDKARGKGKTGVDKGTRNLNFLGIALGLGLAAIFNGFSKFFFPGGRTPAGFFIGVAIMLAGMALRFWAVATLGIAFRTTIETDGNQKVIRNGPYKRIRHPAYSGWLLMCLGYGISLQNWLSVLAAVILPLTALLYRIHVEEPVLASAFGSEYVDYQKHTKKLIPWIW
jgi:protein-S-isoprenylcysteine O-methyltransferase Ste14